MKALVTGASGFVGGHLCRHLKEKGDEVLGTVLTGERVDCDVFERHLDVRDFEECLNVSEEFNPDVVYHLAAVTFVPKAERNFKLVLDTNVAGVDNLLRALVQTGFKGRVILISSAEVYGKIKGEDLPVSEECSLKPVNNYSISKVMGEYVAAKYVGTAGLRVVVFRPFNHTGPGQDNSFAVSSFASQLAAISAGLREPVVRVGNLEAKRDFLDVRDVVRAYRLGAARENGVYNLCSGRAVKIRDVLNMLIEISGLNIEVKPDPARMRPSEIPEIYGNAEKAIKELQWEPVVDLEDTLRDLYNYWVEKMKKR